jgi:predicted phosphodiesterase
MVGMTWLHLSDWHQRGKDFDRDVVRDALIDDISKRANIHSALAKLDFIIFSGDVAFSGQAEEYQVALEQFFTPLLKTTGVQRKRFFFVPGNHDLDRDELNYLPPDIKQPFTTESQVQDWLIDNKKRNHLLKPFVAYTDFVREFTGQEQPAYVNIRSFVVDGKQVALLGLNSALMCGRNKNAEGEVSDQNFLIVGEPQLYEPLKQLAQAQVRIAVLHHPFEWLVEFDRDHVENRLRRDCHFILCGHQHKPNISVERGMVGDCVIIPAGASYDTRVASNPRYTNSYNFVHLDFETAQGTIYLRRWSEPRDQWIEDIDSHKGGMVQFSLPDSLRNIAPSSIKPDQKQQKTDTSPDPSVQQGQKSKQAPPNEQARESIREAHDAVQRSKGVFEGRGDIQQIHYSQAAAALRLVASCTQNLQNLLQTTSPFPAYLDRERLIIDLRHINTEVKESIEYIANYGTLNARQRERNRKDTAARLSTTLTYLDDLNKRLTSKGPL